MLIGKRMYSKGKKSLISAVEKVALEVKIVLLKSDLLFVSPL